MGEGRPKSSRASLLRVAAATATAADSATAHSYGHLPTCPLIEARVRGPGSRVQGLGPVHPSVVTSRSQGPGSRVYCPVHAHTQGSGFSIQVLSFSIQGLGFSIQGLGFSIQLTPLPLTHCAATVMVRAVANSAAKPRVGLSLDILTPMALRTMQV